MRVTEVLAYCLLPLLVVLNCEALRTGSHDLALFPRSGSRSPSPPKSPHHQGHSAKPPGSPSNSRPATHPSHSTQAAHHESSSSPPPSLKGKKQPSHLAHLEQSLLQQDLSKNPRTRWWKKVGGKPPVEYGSGSARKKAAQARAEKQVQGGHLGHLAAELQPGSNPAKGADKAVPWWKKKGGQPLRAIGTSPRYVKDRLYRERKKLRKELEQILEKPSEHHDHSPTKKGGGGGPGSPGGSGAGQAVSRRRLRVTK